MNPVIPWNTSIEPFQRLAASKSIYRNVGSVIKLQVHDSKIASFIGNQINSQNVDSFCCASGTYDPKYNIVYTAAHVIPTDLRNSVTNPDSKTQMYFLLEGSIYTINKS